MAGSSASSVSYKSKPPNVPTYLMAAPVGDSMNSPAIVDLRVLQSSAGTFVKANDGEV